ncbi:MAG: MFS transporter [Anaerolineaceae bacterium]
MQTEKPVASFWFRLPVAALTILGGTLVLLAAQTLSGFHSSAMPLAATSQLGLPPTDIGVLNLIRQIALVVTAFLTGVYGGRFGWRKVALAGIIILSISTGISGVMTSFAGLAVASFGAGFGSGMLLTAMIVLALNDIGTHWLLASAAALYFAISEISSVFGAVSFVLIQQAGFQTGFLMAGGVCLGIGLAGLGLIGIALLVRRSRTWKDEWLDLGRDSFQKPGLILILAAAFLVGWANQASSFGSIFASQTLGLSSSEVGLVFAAVGAATLFAALASFLSGGFADLFDWLTPRIFHRKIGRLIIFTLGIIILCAGFGILLAAKEPKGLTAGLIALPVGLAVLSPPLFALLISRAPHRLWGLVTGLFLAAESLGSLGNIINGLAANTLGFTSVWIISAIVSLAALALVTISGRFDTAVPISGRPRTGT